MLVLKNIRKTYETNNFKQVALDNINLKFRKKEFVCILGPSGSGKTTLLNIIGGLDKYDSGDLIINNKSTKNFKDVNWDSYRNSCVGFIFQNYNLINHISVLKNVEIALTLRGISYKKRRKKAIEALDKVGLIEHINKKPNELSGGQMQRVAIARALVNDPDIILADEPTGALDSKTSIEIMDIIKKISDDKLVIMVTHNEKIAKNYSSRIIKIADGKIKEDSNPLKQKKENSFLNIKKTSMSFIEAFKLSFNNISTKKVRTFFTSFAASVGIIGISLILSLSNGFNRKLNSYEEDSVMYFPISISKSVSLFNNEKKDTKKIKKNELLPYDENGDLLIHYNKINNDFINYLNNMNNSLINAISYERITSLNLLSSDNKKVKALNTSYISINELPTSFDNDYLKNNYDLLYGSYPKDSSELILIVDKDNKINKKLLELLFINENESISYDKIVGKELKLVFNNDYYKKITDDLYVKNDLSLELYNNINNKTLKIVGILRGKKDKNYINYSSLCYKKELINDVVNANKKSEIILSQQKTNKAILMMEEFFEDNNYDIKYVLTYLGANDLPSSINIYPKDFNSKNKIKDYLDGYNYDKKQDDKVMYLDYAKEVSALSSNIIKSIAMVLIVFCLISLIVSSIMLCIITYISVLERTREIGILRSLGARKKDITRIFNTETLIIGTLSGIIGIVISKIILIPINSILYKLTSLKNIGVLNPIHSIILIMLSIIITLVAGYIPSKIAGRKNLVEVLRKE